MTGSLQIKNGKYYAVLNFKTEDGKRKQKWINTDLDVKGNKRKAEVFLQKALIKNESFSEIKTDILFCDYILKWLDSIKNDVEIITWEGYENAIKKHIYPYEGNKQVAAMLSLAEMVDADRISNNVIKPKGAEGLSTFWGYYILQALAKSGDYGAALEIIRKYWGKMLELGATTFWEDFDIKWTENAGRIDEFVPGEKKDIHGDFGKHCYKGFRHSLCHGWASGPTAFLSQYVLGISIKEAGCKEVEIRPALAGLKWVKGKFPTPYGEICVEHSEMKGKIKSKVSAPNEIKIIL